MAKAVTGKAAATEAVASETAAKAVASETATKAAASETATEAVAATSEAAAMATSTAAAMATPKGYGTGRNRRNTERNRCCQCNSELMQHDTPP
jgi:hypothetical protein